MAQSEGEPPDLWYFDLMTGSPDRQATRSSDFLIPPPPLGEMVTLSVQDTRSLCHPKLCSVLPSVSWGAPPVIADHIPELSSLRVPESESKFGIKSLALRLEIQVPRWTEVDNVFHSDGQHNIFSLVHSVLNSRSGLTPAKVEYVLDVLQPHGPDQLISAEPHRTNGRRHGQYDAMPKETPHEPVVPIDPVHTTEQQTQDRQGSVWRVGESPRPQAV
jgi:hypothetical protein